MNEYEECKKVVKIDILKRLMWVFISAMCLVFLWIVVGREGFRETIGIWILGVIFNLIGLIHHLKWIIWNIRFLKITKDIDLMLKEEGDGIWE